MKKLLFFLPALILFACSETAETTTEEVVSQATIKGIVENAKGPSVTIRHGEQKHLAEIDEAGNFTISFDVEEAGSYFLAHGGEHTQMFIEPNDEITVSFNTDEFDESISYKGTGSEENNYLASKFLMEEKLTGDYKEVYSQDEEAFVKQKDLTKAKMMENLKTHLKKSPELNKDFLVKEKFALIYAHASALMNYENYHKHFTKKDEVKLSDNYFAFVKELNMEDDRLIEVSEFNSFFSNLVIEKGRKKAGDDASQDEIGMASMAVIQTLTQNEKIRDNAYYAMMKDQLYYQGSDIGEEVIAAFKSNCKNEEFVGKIMEEFTQWQTLAKGKDAPAFSYPNIEGEEIALADLQGKYVYIDVWATWCGPCRAEMPHLEELQEKYDEDSNIVFTSVSIDENTEAWRKMVKEKEMKGVQLLADKAWDSGICEDYLIKGIPRFILIDPQGKIMNSKAPRPSSDEIKEVFAEIAAENTLTSMK